MVKAFEAEDTIRAPAETVWAILTDGSAWPAFDPTCERVEGEIAPGAQVKVFSTLSPGRAFPVRVAAVEPPRRMVWTGGLPLGLFKGVRSFELEPRADGAIDFRLREEFSGPLLFLIGRTLPDLDAAFRGFVAGLKARAESAAPGALAADP